MNKESNYFNILVHPSIVFISKMINVYIYITLACQDSLIILQLWYVALQKYKDYLKNIGVLR